MPSPPPFVPPAADPPSAASATGGAYDLGDVLGATEFGAFHLSADGKRLALARYEYVKALGARPSRVVVLELATERGGGAGTGAREAVAFASDADGWAPELSDDGEALLFLTDYSGEARPWVASGSGAAAAPVAGIARMASVAKWRPRAEGATGRRGLAFLSFATRDEQGVDDPIEWDKVPAAGFRHLFFVEGADEATGEGAAAGAVEPRRITSGPEDVYDFAWLPDGEALAVMVAPSFEMERHLESELRIVEVRGGDVGGGDGGGDGGDGGGSGGGRVRARFGLPRGLCAFLSVSPAGTHAAFLGHGTGERAGKPDLFTLRLADGAVQCVSEGVPGYVSRYDWAPGGRGLIFPAAEGLSTRVYHAALGGHADGTAGFAPPRLLWEPRGFVGGLSVARRARRVAFRLEGPRTPACLVVAPLEGTAESPTLGAPRQVTGRSARKEARIPGDAIALSATSGDGRPVDALLVHPRRGEPVRRPLCVWLHGGPNEFCALSFQPWWQLFVARGFTVLAPNFRGSGSYDTERVRWNVGDLGGGDADDVLAAIEAAAAHPEAGPHLDASRVMLFGWSYGAFLAFHVARRLGERHREPPASAAAAARAPSLLRVVAGGGVYDWLSHYGQADLRFFWRDYLGGSPLLDAAQADARSPVRQAARLAELQPRCEYLLVHGLNDGRASPQQSRMMYRALREAGATARLLLYPREAHLLVEPRHITDLLTRATAPLP